MDKKNRRVENELPHELASVEKLLQEAAALLPEPTREVSIAEETIGNGQYEGAENIGDQRRKAKGVRKMVQAAAIVLAVLLTGTTTAFAASPVFRQSVIRFFTSGLAEEIPEITPEPEYQTHMSTTADHVMETQTVGAVTMTGEYSLDTHFAAMYLASSQHLDLLYTPSGDTVFRTRETDGQPAYYVVEDGLLKQVQAQQCSQTAEVKVQGPLPGIMRMGEQAEAGL